MNRYYISGKQINLGESIGKGGEGEVYLSENLPSKAIKIYSDLGNTLRIEKIKKMVDLQLAKKSNLISFPDEVVTTSSGQVVGFSMNFVRDHVQIHELYGVKSRKQFFPDADYRFLVRVAANISRAFAQVHSYPCVIGDVNHSGVLISKNATVALIDADSFQLKDNGNLYPCVVGVPDFTPPELQGKSLRNIERTPIHDEFGLAVLIFQILVMGRHPFAGKGLDLTLEECITQCLFAYTKSSSQGIIPPPGVPSLDSFPSTVSSAFEYSFSSSGKSKRTTAKQWVSILDDMERSLVKCSTNAKHFYPQQSNSCPWCKMESTTGVILFNGGITLISSQFTMADVERILTDVLSFKVDETTIFPKLPESFIQSASWSAKSSKWKRVVKKVLSIFLWITMAVLILAFFSQLEFITLIFAGLSGWFAHYLGNNENNRWIKNYQILDEQWNTMLNLWREKSLSGIFHTKYNLEKAIWELKQLEKEKDAKLHKLKEGLKEKQLQNYLDNFLIKNANIKSITKSLVSSLASHGIESAADIEYNKVRGIPQFGDVRTGNLVAWRQQIERNFQYNPSQQMSDVTAKNQIHNEFELKMRDKKSYIEQQKKVFDLSRTEFTKSLQKSDYELSQKFLEKENLKFDLQFLMIPIPSTTRSNFSINKPTFSPNSGVQQSSALLQTQVNNAPNCPRCSSAMVRRWGRRGGFWGCSRYPRCKGTRNY